MMALSQAALAVKGRMIGADTVVHAVTTDSRKAAAGDLFVALRGEKFDGHDFTAQCIEQGAAAVMVERGISSGAPQLIVADTRLGLGDLAAHWRTKFDIPLAAVTGSNGKTTVKEMLAAILRLAAGANNVLVTEGNLNNDIGLPLTLLQLRAEHRYAVTEMGMNHPGEIAYLTRIAKPTVALINNAQPAHLAGLGSIEAVAKAKGEIFEALSADGIAVLNADDPYIDLWKQLAAPHRISTFGLDRPADVRAEYQLHADSSVLDLNTLQGNIHVRLAVPGLHNVRNALAATCAALAMGIRPVTIAQGLEQFGGVKGRLQRKQGKNDAVIIDDTYNANPASMHAAIGVLSRASGKRIFAMGDMGELGSNAAELHATIGSTAKDAGVDALYALGQLSGKAVETFGPNAHHFETPEALADALRDQLAPNVTVLVKGSRFMRMERVVEHLVKKENTPCC